MNVWTVWGTGRDCMSRGRFFPLTNLHLFPLGLLHPDIREEKLENGMETRRCRAQKGRGKLENYWKFPAHWGCMMFLYLQEYDAVILLLRAQQPRPARAGPACLHQSNIRWHFCHLVRLEWTVLLLLMMTTTVVHDQQSGNSMHADNYFTVKTFFHQPNALARKNWPEQMSRLPAQFMQTTALCVIIS